MRAVRLIVGGSLRVRFEGRRRVEGIEGEEEATREARKMRARWLGGISGKRIRCW